MKPRIGFIGQGWIGKTYADDFEHRGFEVVRYAMEEPYVHNKRQLTSCDVVFIAVPTPTTPAGFDASIVRAVLPLVGAGKTAVIKSTLLPGTTEALQREFPELVVMHSPEFLSVATAKHDAEHPTRNIIGIVDDTPDTRARANAVLAVLPLAPYAQICTSREAELIKYSRNCMGFVRVVFVNLLYDLARALDVEWEPIRRALAADPDCGPTYISPVHKTGRGAGGACFIKDFEALSRLYRSLLDDPAGAAIFDTMTAKNIALLLASGKDLDLLAGVHGIAARQPAA
ncbi:MAG TPA: hypothetical protein VFQ53_06960 [Kofleriaceae bacterium]|nr:hypothetical protein [Kofleriaceae bacterium]